MFTVIVNKSRNTLNYLIIIALAGILFPLFSNGSPVINGQNLRIFYVDSKYEIDGNREETALFLLDSAHAKIFVEKKYYENLSENNQRSFFSNVSALVAKFDSDIYFTERKLFGEEWSPGIDKDARITIYITEMKKDIDGYFRETDEYDIVESNKREMIYINARYINQSRAPAILAHEFQHLINFNQKNRLRGVNEAKWLNEALSEYAVTATGFDGAGDYLKKTSDDFIANPTNSLGIWESAAIDRASVSLFIHYLAGRYGENILQDIIQSKFVGEEAINFALKKNGFSENFSDVFADWTVALFLNSNTVCHPELDSGSLEIPKQVRNDTRCEVNVYKFNDPELKYSNFHIMPQLDYYIGDAGFNASFVVRDLSPEWHRFLPARYTPQEPKTLRIDFSGREDYYFRIPVVVTYLSGNIEVVEANMKNGSGFVEIPDFTGKISSVVIIPASHTKLSDFSQSDPLRTFSYKINLLKTNPDGLVDGDIVSLDGRDEVYVVKNNYRRHLRSPVFFDFYSHLKWSSIKTISEDALDGYKESNLIRMTGDYKVYEIVGFNEIRWLDMTAKEFEEAGYDWNAVYEVNDAELSWYKNKN